VPGKDAQVVNYATLQGLVKLFSVHKILRNLRWLVTFLALVAMAVLPRLYWPLRWGFDRAHRLSGDVTFFTPDSYVFGTILKRAIEELPQHPQLGGVEAYGLFTFIPYVFIKYLNFPFDLTLFYWPVALSPLLIVGAYLLARGFDCSSFQSMGSAFLTSTSWVLFQRTTSGYLDTDVVAVGWLLLCLGLYSWSHKTEHRLLIRRFAFFSIFLYPLWYDKGYLLLPPVLMIMLLYAIWEKRPVPLPSSGTAQRWTHKIPFCTAVEGKKGLCVVFLSLIIGALMSLMMPMLWGHFSLYMGWGHDVLQSSGVSQAKSPFLYDFKSVAEVKPLPISKLGPWVCGHQALLPFAITGILFLMRNKKFILLLPFLGLGSLALFSASRFAIFLGPLLALSLIYGVKTITKVLEKNRLRFLCPLLLIAFGACYLQHALEMPLRPSVSADEIKGIRSIRKHAGERKGIESHRDQKLTRTGARKPTTQVINWWDDALLLDFYGNVSAVMPYNSFGGPINFWMSQALLNPHPEVSYSLMAAFPTKTHALNDWNPKTLDFDQKNIKHHPSETYLYLPKSLIYKMGSLQKFTRLRTGQAHPKLERKEQVFQLLPFRTSTSDEMIFDHHFRWSKKSFMMQKGQSAPFSLNSISMVAYAQAGAAEVKMTHVDLNSQLHLILIPSDEMAILMSSELLQSPLLQMGLFHRYEAEKFASLSLNSKVAVFMLKVH
jgi:hypothetical protein